MRWGVFGVVALMATVSAAQTIEQAPLPDIAIEGQNNIPAGDTVAPTDEQPEVFEEPQDSDDAEASLNDVERVAPASFKAEPAPIARIRALDKITGALETFELRTGETYQYERLEIKLDSCQVFPKRQDYTMFVEIYDDSRDNRVAFTGWMFSSSPALSAMDHPRYDVWLLNCKTDSGEEAEADSAENVAE